MRWLAMFLIPLGGFAALAIDAAVRVPKAQPHFAVAMRNAAEFDGKRIWVSPSPVVKIDPDGVVVEDRGARLKILTMQTVAPGSFVYARGVFHKDGTLVPDAVRVAANWKVERGGIYGISAIVLLFFTGAFLKNFRPSLRGIAPREAPGNAAPESLNG